MSKSYVLSNSGKIGISNYGTINGNCVSGSNFYVLNYNVNYTHMSEIEKLSEAIVNLTETQKNLSETQKSFAESSTKQKIADINQSEANIIMARATEKNADANLINAKNSSSIIAYLAKEQELINKMINFLDDYKKNSPEH